MTEEQKPTRTRRPRGLTSHLHDLREQNDRAILKLGARRDRLSVELSQVDALIDQAHAERARLNLAIGDARDGADLPRPAPLPAAAAFDAAYANTVPAPVVPAVQGVEVVRVHADGTQTVDSTHSTVDAAVAAAHGEARVINGAAE